MARSDTDEDNQSTIYVARNPQFVGRTKHIGIKYHFIREQVNHQRVKLTYCPMENMTANVLTKALSQERFEILRNMCEMSSVNVTAN